MKKFLITLAAFIAVFIAFSVYLSHRKYNVVIITIDTLRYDYLSCYKKTAPSTPNIDRIAKEGVMFTNAYSLIPITLPSHASMFTSHYPHNIKLFNNGNRFKENAKLPMLSDFFERKDYETGAFVSLGVLKRVYGLGQGFNKYEDDFDNLNGRFYKWAGEVNQAGFKWLDKVQKDPFFAWFHYSDPHEPYITVDAPPDTVVRVNGQEYGRYCLAKKEHQTISTLLKPGTTELEVEALLTSRVKKLQALESRRYVEKYFLTAPQNVEIKFGPEWKENKMPSGSKVQFFQQKGKIYLINKGTKETHITFKFGGGVLGQRIEDVRRNYGLEVQYVDKEIGRLWKRLEDAGLLRNTIIIITSDHGEGLKDHGMIGHVDRLWNETIKIPLIIYYPGFGFRGRSVNEIVNLMDVMPTVLDLVHFKNPNKMEGQSLKHYVSWSPIDWITSSPVKRYQSFVSTFQPEARLNSFAMTDGKIKLIHTPNREFWKWEAYDLEKDPAEKGNIARLDPKRFKTLATQQKLLETFRTEAEAAHGSYKAPPMSEAEKEMLIALGYTHGDDDH